MMGGHEQPFQGGQRVSGIPQSHSYQVMPHNYPNVVEQQPEQNQSRLI